MSAVTSADYEQGWFFFNGVWKRSNFLKSRVQHTPLEQLVAYETHQPLFVPYPNIEQVCATLGIPVPGQEQ